MQSLRNNVIFMHFLGGDHGSCSVQIQCIIDTLLSLSLHHTHEEMMSQSSYSVFYTLFHITIEFWMSACMCIVCT